MRPHWGFIHCSYPGHTLGQDTHKHQYPTPTASTQPSRPRNSATREAVPSADEHSRPSLGLHRDPRTWGRARARDAPGAWLHGGRRLACAVRSFTPTDGKGSNLHPKLPPQSPGCRNCRNCRTTVGPLSELTVGLTVGHCLTLSDYRTWHHPPALSDTVGQLSDTVGRLSDTVGRLSDCRRQLVGDHRTTLNAGMKACACCKVL